MSLAHCLTNLTHNNVIPTLLYYAGVLEKYGALCIGVIGEAPKEGGAAPTAAAPVDDDDELQFGEMVPFGDPSW